MPSAGPGPQAHGLMAQSGLPRLEARMLLAHVLGRPQAWLLAHDTDALAPADAAAFLDLAARRLAGEPMAYLLGEREFMGHLLRVTPEVLIPRPETELLVETGLAHLRGLDAGMQAGDAAEPQEGHGPAAASAGPDPAPVTSPDPTPAAGPDRWAVADLGTGSGAIAVSLALACPRAAVTATDASAAALAVAAGNAQRLGARVDFRQGDWYGALPPGARYHLIVANPPYIAAGDAHLQEGDLRHEPPAALTDGADGLSALRVLAVGAPARLAPGGAVWLEHGWDQAQAVRALLAAAGLRGVASRRDLAGIERISGGYL